MNRGFFEVAAVALGLFMVGAVGLPDDTFIRLLAFWSLAMSLQLVRATWRLGLEAAMSTTPGQLGVFALGLLLVNLSTVMQRLFGFAVRDFGQAWMLHSDIFSVIIAAMIAGQALKFAAIDANGGGIVKGRVAAVSIARSFAVGTVLYLVYWAIVRPPA